MTSIQNEEEKNTDLKSKDYKLGLEKIAKKLPYFWFFASLTIMFEIGRLIMDYSTIVWKLGFPIEELFGYWTRTWMVFLWPITSFLIYFSIIYLRNYSLKSLSTIYPQLKNYPTETLKTIYLSRKQHLIPLFFGIVCVLSFAYSWLTNSSYMFNNAIVLLNEIPEFYFFNALWVCYNWIIGGYFVWICVSVVFLSRRTSALIKNFDLINHDKAGGLRVMGSLAMRTAFFFIFSVSFMYPGWILQPAIEITIIGQFYQFGTIVGLIIIEMALFFLPMFFFHSEMSKAKIKKLKELDSQITNYLNKIDEKTTLKEKNIELLGILSLRQVVESMNEYPFNIQMLVKVMISAVIPFLLLLFQLTVQLIFRIGL